MGECINLRRSGNPKKLPILNANYPQDVTTTVIKGNTTSATFTAVISEAGNPASYTYQWYVNGSAVSGATGSSYTMSGLSETAAYSVYCEITNKAGTVQTRAASLKVTQYYTPVLNTSYPANVTGATVGGSAEFKVTIETAGNPASYTYQWYVNGSAVSGATSSSYTKSNLTLGSYAVYCRVTNDAGTVQSRTATLTVTALKIVPNPTTYGSGAWTKAGSTSEVSVSQNATTITLKASRYAVAYAVVKVDVSNLSKIEFKGTVTDATASSGAVVYYAAVFKDLPAYVSSGIIYATGYNSNISDGDKLTLNNTYDVSALTGYYYVGIAVLHTNASDKLHTIATTFTSLKLTK